MMELSFPQLEARPAESVEVLFALDALTSRPRVWDEHGMPLDSYYSDEFRPTRCPADYASVDPAHYTPRMVTDKEGWGMNVGLMDYVKPHFSETLHLVLDAARAFRAVREIPDNRYLALNEGLELVTGLNSLWALLMYRREHRVANGALPSHVADVHRTFIGYEGIFDSMVDDVMPPVGTDDDETLSLSDLVDIAMNGLKGDLSEERCPASRRIIEMGMIALLAPLAEARETLLPTLSRCAQPRLLADMHVDDETFTKFAAAVQELTITETAENLAVVQTVLDGGKHQQR